MLINRPVPFLDLVLSISEATDLIDLDINDHGKRVAFIALNIANELELNSSDKHTIIIAGLLHDIGAFSLQDKLKVASFEFEFKYDTKEINKHGELGYMLLRKFKPLSEIAEIIRYHHFTYKETEKLIDVDKNILLFSQIIHLADRIDILINRKSNILSQVKNIHDRISQYSEEYFNPKLVEVRYCQMLWIRNHISSNYSLCSHLLR